MWATWLRERLWEMIPFSLFPNTQPKYDSFGEKLAGYLYNTSLQSRNTAGQSPGLSPNPTIQHHPFLDEHVGDKFPIHTVSGLAALGGPLSLAF